MIETSATIGELMVAVIDHRGITPRKLGGDFEDSGVPVISADNVYDGRLHIQDVRFVSPAMYRRWMSEPLKPWDVLMTSEAPAGEMALFNENQPFCLGQRLFALRPDPSRLEPHYLYYFLASPIGRHRIRERLTGTVAEGIRQAELRKVVIDLLPLNDQAAIGHALGALDDKIDLNRNASATLEALIRALFASRFGVLDPDQLADGWTAAQLGEHVEVTRGLSYNGAGLANEGIPLHNLDSIADVGGYRYEGIKHYRGDYKPRHVIRAGDLLVVNTDLTWAFKRIAQPALVPQRFGDLSLFSHHLYRVRPQSRSWLTGRFLYLALMSPRLRQVIVGYSNGTTVNMLPADALQRPSIAVPPAVLVRRFDQTVQPLFAKQEQLQTESETLAKLRDLILPKLMSGEIRLKDAETAAVEAG